MKLITYNLQTWTDENLMHYTHKKQNKDRFTLGMSNKLIGRMNGYFEGNRSYYCYLLICGLYCLLVTIHLTAFLSFDC